MKEKVLFEVCCGCFEDAVQAEKGGADRIELNSALFLGGLTPSIGTVQAVTNTLKIPVMCMVRPREGGFCYTDFDYMTCCRDMDALLNAGADGIVFGFLKPDGTVDTDRCADFIGKIKKINPNAARGIPAFPHHGRRTAGKALRPPRRSAPQGGRALQQRKPARQGSQHLWGGRSAEH